MSSGIELIKEAQEFIITVEEIKDRLEPIHKCAYSGDDEDARLLEGDLYHDVLQAIVNGVSKPRKLARAAIEASRLRACGVFWQRCIE